MFYYQNKVPIFVGQNLKNINYEKHPKSTRINSAHISCMVDHLPRHDCAKRERNKRYFIN